MLNDLTPWDKKTFNDAQNGSFSEASKRFPPVFPGSDGINDNHNDAFRHAFWNAQMVEHFGEDWARDYATSHEQLPGNDPVREAMDLYNNEVGSKIALDNPDASISELADLVEDAVRDGEMVVVNQNGDLVFSDQIPQEEAGHPRGGDPPLPGKDPEHVDWGS